ncbi:MAG: YlbF family regulator [Clostridia bacterium]|nr:YlbF family regulator [Clostridia bacterium]MBQ2000404.1 YlbF family regulator [Clostridia bacterium]
MENIIKSVRELGKAIQADETFKAYIAAKMDADNDEALQNAIGEFNLVKMQISEETQKEDKDEAKLQELNVKLRKCYADIIANEKMQKYNNANQLYSGLINKVYAILEMCCNGEDPETCEPEEHSCSGSCSTCGGCH